MTNATIIADSLGPNGARLTTFQLRFPRFILAQFNTHRAISKNARSSRAVPIEKLILEVESDPVIPLCWGKNRRGMQAVEKLAGPPAWRSEQAWLDARDHAVACAHHLLGHGVHKQIVNRLLEPFLWVDVVATATEWANFFALRCDKHAQPEIQALAVAMARAYRDSQPWELEAGWWHLPYIAPQELAGLCEERAADDPDLIGEHEHNLIKVSVARCARVSYLAFDGTPSALEKDARFYDDLVGNGHWSPTEHQGSAQYKEAVPVRSGNFLGFDQHRQFLAKSVHRTFDFSTLDQFGEEGYVLEEVAA